MIIKEKEQNMDDIINILYDGTKNEIKRVLEEKKVSYTFSQNLECYTIQSDVLFEIIRGYKPHYKPNCIDYFGYEYSYKNK